MVFPSNYSFIFHSILEYEAQPGQKVTLCDSLCVLFVTCVSLVCDMCVMYVSCVCILCFMHVSRVLQFASFHS